MSRRFGSRPASADAVATQTPSAQRKPSSPRPCRLGRSPVRPTPAPSRMTRSRDTAALCVRFAIPRAVFVIPNVSRPSPGRLPCVTRASLVRHPGVSVLSSRGSSVCHPERMRGISPWRAGEIPRLRRGMTSSAWLGMTSSAWLGMTRSAWLGMTRSAWLGTTRTGWLGDKRLARSDDGWLARNDAGRWMRTPGDGHVSRGLAMLTTAAGRARPSVCRACSCASRRTGSGGRATARSSRSA